MILPPTKLFHIAVRTYARAAGDTRSAAGKRSHPVENPFGYSLIFDCETTVDAAQRLRFGFYQARKAGRLVEEGAFYDPEAVSREELALLEHYTQARGLKLLTREAFVETVFYVYGYLRGGEIVGFNLPFDLSRIAISGEKTPRNPMYGGFSLKLSENKYKPPVQVRSLSRRMALYRFARPPKAKEGPAQRNRGLRAQERACIMLDVSTAASALMARGFTLATLCETLQTSTRKQASEEHGGALSETYLDYARADVQATWECAVALKERYARYGLSQPLHRIYSEASLGKAMLGQLGVRPFAETKATLTDRLRAAAASTYYGGRAEVRLRRAVREVVLCDFLSMYPTVSALMGNWGFIIAETLEHEDATAEIAAFLERVTLEDVQRPEFWPGLAVLVRVTPEADILPVRATYRPAGDGFTASPTIGLNHLTSDKPFWFTLADCIASKLLTGRAPKVLEAAAFRPGAPQAGLKTLPLLGDPDRLINPVDEDLFKAVIEERARVKAQLKQAADAQERDAFSLREQALKILANATGYGIYAEVIAEDGPNKRRVDVIPANEPAFVQEMKTVEKPGRYNHPLLATFITGAARLMLATLERLVTDRGLQWAFCDTDSMAIARPEGMAREVFTARVAEIVAWFEALNPYGFGGSILKVEDVNFSLDDPQRREPLFVFAVSAKRYALFNIGQDGAALLRKASGHGLGHLLAPYREHGPAHPVPAPVAGLAKLGVDLWQHDVWWLIVDAARRGDPLAPGYDRLPGFDAPAAHRFSVTTPEVAKWVRAHNKRMGSYAAGIKPFGFLIAFTGKRPASVEAEPRTGKRTQLSRLPKPIAAFDRDPRRAAANAFDRETGKPVPVEALQTYHEALQAYHLHPEDKFENADYLDTGETRRRHVTPDTIRHIGKEANQLDRDASRRDDLETVIDYGLSPQAATDLREALNAFATQTSWRSAAKALDVPIDRLKTVALTQCAVSSSEVSVLNAKLEKAIAQHEVHQREKVSKLESLAEAVRRNGLKPTARQEGMDPANLRKLLRRHQGARK